MTPPDSRLSMNSNADDHDPDGICEDGYPEHDWESMDERDGVTTYRCRRIVRYHKKVSEWHAWGSIRELADPTFAAIRAAMCLAS